MFCTFGNGLLGRRCRRLMRMLATGAVSVVRGSRSAGHPAYPGLVVTMERLERLAGADTGWQRPEPTPEQRHADVGTAVGFLLVTALGVELLRSMGALSQSNGVAEQYAAVVSAALLLVFRRSHPLPVAAGAAAHLLVCSTLVPSVVATLPMQILYFVAIYSGVAWARERRSVPYVVLSIVAVTFAWFAWWFALSSGIQELSGNLAEEQVGLLPPLTGAVLFVLLNNVLFFTGATVLGQVAWRGAHDTAQVVEQAHTIAVQSARLRDQAVVAERLRIARELHDVVAHHVSVMGVQAAAARRVLRSQPEVAAEALSAVETSSRDAVGQMRDLLGTLRAGEEAADAGSPGDASTHAVAGSASQRSPAPSLADLSTLVTQAATPTCTVEHTVVESSPGAAQRVPQPVQLSAYRVVQEALANVRRHSTARRATATVRVDEAAGTLEVEVVDDGRPRTGTSGTGLGHLGMRERAQHLGGGVEVGPRAETGYRVRVWLPIDGVHRAPARQEVAR